MNAQDLILYLKSKPRVGVSSGAVGPDGKPLDTNAAKAVANDFGESIAAGINTAFNSITLEVFNKIASVGTDFLNTATKVTTQFDFLNKTLGISTQQSARLAANLAKIAKLNDESSISFKDYAKSLQQIQTILPGVSTLLSAQAATAALNKESIGSTLDLHAKMVNLLGVSETSANGITQALLASGENTQTFGDNLAMVASVIERTTGETGVLRDMLDAVGQTTATTRLSFRGNVEELAKAALHASRLGTTLSQAEANADNLLNIESSIGAELEFQQLTGNQILDDQGNSITNQIRLARLTGNTGEILKLQADAIRKNYDQLKGDPLALKAFAESMGMTTEQLAQQNEIIQARDKLMAQVTSKAIPGGLQAVLEKYGVQDIYELAAKGDDAVTDLEGILGKDSPIVKTFKDYSEATDIRTPTEKLNTAIESLTAEVIKLTSANGNKLAEGIASFDKFYKVLAGEAKAAVGSEGADKTAELARKNIINEANVSTNNTTEQITNALIAGFKGLNITINVDNNKSTLTVTQ